MLTMKLIYLASAAVGGVLLVVQTLLALLGGDSDVDLEADDLSGGGSGLSFRTVVAFMTFFGLAGLACLRADYSATRTLLVALGAGATAFWLVGLALLQLHKLQSAGNVEIANAVGTEAVVYLKVPGARRGTGAVTVPVQGRSVQFKAVTRGAELPTGEFCRVTAVRGTNTLEVELVPKPEVPE